MMDVVLSEGEPVQVVAVNRLAGLVMLESGETAPVCNWFDCQGEECEPMEAVACVAGPISGRNTLSFVSVNLREFQPAPLQ